MGSPPATHFLFEEKLKLILTNIIGRQILWTDKKSAESIQYPAL